MNRAVQIYQEYPRNFWMMIGVNFIDRLGGSLLFPFFALYITQKFDVGMTQVGVLFAAFSISSFIGAFPGGALDRSLWPQGHHYLQPGLDFAQHTADGVCE